MLQRWIEVRMGNLVFGTADGRLLAYNKPTDKFERELTTLASNDKFVMAMGPCAGVFARNLADDTYLPFALAHMSSMEMARRMLGGNVTYQQVREHLAQQQVAFAGNAFIEEIAQEFPELAAELRASLFDNPIAGPDLVAQRIITAMGHDIEVRVFGGQCLPGQIQPDVITGLAVEFRKLGINALVEDSLFDLPKHGRIAMISPFAAHPSDYVRPAKRFDPGPSETMLHVNAGQ